LFLRWAPADESSGGALHQPELALCGSGRTGLVVCPSGFAAAVIPCADLAAFHGGGGAEQRCAVWFPGQLFYSALFGGRPARIRRQSRCIDRILCAVLQKAGGALCRVRG